MAAWRERVRRLCGFGRTHITHAELDQEFAAHRDLAVDDYLKRGYSIEDARRLAAVRFGSTLSSRERVDDQRSLPLLEHILADLHHALRGLRRTPRFTALAVLVLAVGIAVNLAVFTVTSATLFKGFRGIPDQHDIVYVSSGRGCCLSYPDLLDWRSAAKSFSGIEAVADLRVSVEAGGTLGTATSTEVTAGLFALLRVAPLIGRDFTLGDDRPGAPRVAILSNHYWRTHFDANPSAIGAAIKVNGEAVTVIGVMPDHFLFPQRQDLWMPMGPRVSSQPRNGRGLWVAPARLAAGITIEQARAEMRSLGAQLAKTYPETNAGVTPQVQTFTEFFVGPDASAVYGSLWAGVGVLLLIACANLVTLLLARASGRARQVGVQLALGAGRSRIVRLHVFETLFLSSAGGLLALWLSPVLLRAYAAVAIPPTQPWAAQLFDYSIDRRAVGYLALIVAAVGVITGLIPALRASRLSIQGVLRDGGRGTVGRSRQRWMTSLVVIFQVGLAVVLLAAAGVLLRSVLNVQQRSLGYDPSKVIVSLSSLPVASYPDAGSQARFLERAASGVRSVPGVDAVAFADGVAGQRSSTSGIEIEGQPYSVDAQQREVRQSVISAGYFRVLGTSLVQGRDFDDRDTVAAPSVIIVNRRFADRYWQTDAVLGRRIRVHRGSTPGPWMTVVGLAPDLHHGDPARADVEPTFYRPFSQRPGRGAWILAHTSGVPAQSLIAPIRQQIQQADPAVPIWLGPYPLDVWNTGSYWKRAVGGGLFMVFALMALVLASLGVLAVMLATVAERRQELSVRVALGASVADIVRLVTRQGITPAMIGLSVGVLVSLGTNRLLASQLVDVSPSDPLALASVAVVLAIATLIGCIAPAVQAARVDPLEAMRGD
jgi:putative ABC transport system permease protein